MSYEIVKCLRIDKQKKEVWLKSTSNNVTPKTYSWWEAKTLSEIYKEQGLEELHKEILLQYYQGMFQKSDNNHEKSLILLDRNKYNWDTVGDSWDHTEKPKESFTYAEVKEVLYTNYLAYNNREKGSFIIINTERQMFLTKFSKSGCFLSAGKGAAKVFTSREEADYKIRSFDGRIYKVEVA